MNPNLRNHKLAILTGGTATVHEAIRNGARMHITVNKEGIVTHAYSPDKPCFRPNFTGESWATVKTQLENHGFFIHGGN